jgi:Tfp pilus assembly protein PilO
MNKLTKTQRDQLIGVAVGAVAIMAALWFLVVVGQQKDLEAIKKKTNTMNETLRNADATVRGALIIGQELTNRVETLQKREADLAPGHDPNSWMIGRVNQFIAPRKGVSVKSISTADINDKGVLPHFPYPWATFHIKAVGYYREFGKLIADFENTFPYYRIQNMDISAAGVGEEEEKLSYSFDIVTPLVPTGQETK